MEAPFGLIMLVGKIVFAGLLYLFLIWAFRNLFRQMGLEAQVAQRGPRPRAAAPVAAQMSPESAPAMQREAPVIAPQMSPAAVLGTARAQLIVDDAGQSALSQGQVLDLTAALTIGRSDDNGLVINDRFCSSHHAMIFLHEGQRLLRDRGSTNGTYHNGRRLTGDVVLRNGDHVSVGTVTMTYRAPFGQ